MCNLKKLYNKRIFQTEMLFNVFITKLVLFHALVLSTWQQKESRL